jgi:hypothetical protein
MLIINDLIDNIPYEQWDTDACEKLIGTIIKHNGAYYAWGDKSKNFEYYCGLIGVDPQYVRQQLRKIHPYAKSKKGEQQ